MFKNFPQIFSSVGDTTAFPCRNQERANRAIAPTPKFLETLWCSLGAHEKLFLEIALLLRELLNNFF